MSVIPTSSGLWSKEEHKKLSALIHNLAVYVD